MKYIRPYIDPIGIRSNTGIKYYKITGKTDHKKPYDQAEALDRALVHAGNFMFNREKQVEYCAALMDRRPIIVAPYDAELFATGGMKGPTGSITSSGKWRSSRTRSRCALHRITLPKTPRTRCAGRRFRAGT